MDMRYKLDPLVLGLALALVAASFSARALAQDAQTDGLDFGALVQDVLQVRSRALFGISEPLAAPASGADAVPRDQAAAGQRLLLAGSLHADYVTRRVATRADMIVLWPDAAHASHLILCIEQPRQGTTPGGHGGLNASVQRVDLATGEVATLLHGMANCDGIRRTPWGTVLATEERADGRAYEILDPLGITDQWIADRATGDVRTTLDGLETSRNVVQRPALPTVAWEGLAVLPGGVVYAGDELRPGTGSLDRDGGALYKFVPDFPRTGEGAISALAASPLASGTVYALSISCLEPGNGNFPQYGQGCEEGVGAWVEVEARAARTEARDHGATGFYRPEDLHADPLYQNPGARVCWSATGQPAAGHYGTVLCAVDPTPLPATPATRIDPRTGFAYLADGDAYATATIERFLEGDPRFDSFDNLDFQPGTGILYVVEDRTFGEIWACLPDGADRDLRSDGCISIASLTDPAAELTGFVFDATGLTAYVVLQHGDTPPALEDFGSNPVDGRTDDLIRITGFEIPSGSGSLQRRQPGP